MTSSNYTRDTIQSIQAELDGKYLIGNAGFIELLMIAYLARGHVLVEGPPGTGKTMSAKLISRLLSRSFNRIQFTSDLLPADILGAHLFDPSKNEFRFIKGPIFSEIILADEINRTPPRTQSALLEAMEERQVTSEGVQLRLSDDFFVIATQNPQDYEGTFALPEVQMDRFLFRITVQHGDLESETSILERILNGTLPPPLETLPHIPIDRKRIDLEIAQVRVDPSVLRYAGSLVAATRNHPLLSAGSSVRGSISLVRAARIRALIVGRNYANADDIKILAPVTLAHRVRLNPEAQVSNLTDTQVITEILRQVPFPA